MAQVKKWMVKVFLTKFSTSLEVYIDALDAQAAVKIAKAQYPTAARIDHAVEVK